MNDETIIRAIQSGDEAAIGRVMDKYSRLLWSVVSAVLSGAAGEQEMEECVADAFIYLWEHPEKFDPQRGKLKSWLSIIARSQAIDRWRAINRRGDVPLEDTLIAECIGAADEVLAKETRQALISNLKALGEPEQEILIRRYYHEQKPKEIALALGMSVKQVNNRLYRAKLKLREQMEAEA